MFFFQPFKTDFLNKNLKLSSFVNNFLGMILFFLIWLIASAVIVKNPETSPFSGFLPLPSIKAFIKLLSTKIFWNSVHSSFSRILFGLCIASVIGIPLGLFIGFYRTLRELTNVSIQFVRMISPLSWMPLAIILLPTFEKAVVFIIAISSLWPMLLNTAQGVMNVQADWIKMAKNQGAKDYQLLFHVIFPASVPYILTGFRFAIGIAWIVLVPAEFLGVSSGLGYLINDARDTLQYDRLMGIILAIGVIGFLIDGISLFIQKRFDWRMK